MAGKIDCGYIPESGVVTKSALAEMLDVSDRTIDRHFLHPVDASGHRINGVKRVTVNGKCYISLKHFAEWVEQNATDDDEEVGPGNAEGCAHEDTPPAKARVRRAAMARS